MKKFLVVEKQSGQGCDYTIGCGTRTSVLEAESMEALVKRLDRIRVLSEEDAYGYGGRTAQASKEEQRLHDQCSGWAAGGESERESVVIYEIGNLFEVPLDGWRDDKAARGRAEANAAKEADERDMLAKLQKKYGATT